MAYISDKERKGMIKDIHKRYTSRKVLIFLNIIFLIVFIILTFISFYKADKDPKSFWNFFNQEWSTVDEKWSTKGLSPWGVVMLLWACIMILMSVINIVLTFSIRSPREVTKKVLELESIPLTGSKKISKSASRSKINAERVGIETK